MTHFKFTVTTVSLIMEWIMITPLPHQGVPVIVETEMEMLIKKVYPL